MIRLLKTGNFATAAMSPVGALGSRAPAVEDEFAPIAGAGADRSS